MILAQLRLSHLVDRMGGALAGYTFGALLLLALMLIYLHLFNWPHADDIAYFEWYKQYFVNKSWSLLGVAGIKNHQHQLGGQALAFVVTTSLFGFNFILLTLLNFVALTAATVVIAWTISTHIQSPALRALLWLVLLALFLHPTQANHILWPFELGWFLITLLLVVNACMIERLREYAIVPVALCCTAASFCSAQGLLLWLCAALHIWLIKDLRGRWPAIAAFVFGFLVLAFFLKPAERGTLPPFSILVTYPIGLYGGLWGVRDKAVIYPLGVLFLATMAFFARRAVRRNPVRPADGIGLVLMASSILCAGAFTLGRHGNGLDWALDQFHYAPLLVPALVGVAIVAIGEIDDRGPYRLPSFAVLALVAGSVVSAAPYGKMRARELVNAKAIAMQAACATPPNDYVAIVASGLSYNAFGRLLYSDHQRAMRTLCSAPPAWIEPLVTLPDLYVQLSAKYPEHRTALLTLWDVYRTHNDLQRGIPVARPDMPRTLLLFARRSAETGSNYEPEILRQHARSYLELEKLADALSAPAPR